MTEPTGSEGIPLYELRERRGLTQVELSNISDMAQNRISTIERGVFKITLSTLSRYVEALGGNLVIGAIFTDEDGLSETYSLDLDSPGSRAERKRRNTP